MRRLRRWQAGGLIFVLMVATLAPSMPAGAWGSNPTGRADYVDFFSGTPYNGVSAGALWPATSSLPGVTDAPGFIDFMRTSLFDATNDRSVGSAAFLMALMMGRQGPDFGNSWAAGVNWARANFDSEFVPLVMQYDAARVSGASWGVNWNVVEVLCHPYYQANLDYSNNDAFFYNNTASPSGEPCETENVITFTNPAGGVFMIKKVCGNPVGDAPPLVTGDFAYTGSIGATMAWAPPAGTPLAPSNVNYASLAAQNFRLDFAVQARNTGSRIGPAGTLTAQPYDAPGITTTAFTQNTPTTRVQSWPFAPLGPAVASPSQAYTVFVDPAVTDNAVLCYTAAAAPSSSLSAAPTTSSPVCYRVIKRLRYPAVIGQNGDIHAGGGVGTGCSGSGVVKSHPQALSYNEYAVAATGLIGDFGSNGRYDDNAWKLASNGNYAVVCRPDLLDVATTYRTRGGGVLITNNNFTVTGRQGVYFYSGSVPLNLSGTVNRKLTVVSLGNAPVRFTGNMILDPTVSGLANAIPSLGVIARGNIIIPAAVTRVDAYLFSSEGAINTCEEGSIACATPPLTINGFIMAGTLLLQRIGPAGSVNSQVAERITLNPNIYLNPPTLFDASVYKVESEHQGERQPLY